MGITNKHTDTHTGRVISVPYHFTSPYLTYNGDEWKIIGTRSGRTRDLGETIHTLVRTKDRLTKEITHAELVKEVLRDQKKNEWNQVQTAILI